MAFVVGSICLLFTLIAAIEFWCELVGWRSIARSLDEWSLINRWFAGALLVVVGIFFAHFLLNPLPCDEQLRPDGGQLPARCATPPKSELVPGSYERR
jgi:putative Mn2+ efflux pump MntP